MPPEVVCFSVDRTLKQTGYRQRTGNNPAILFFSFHFPQKEEIELQIQNQVFCSVKNQLLDFLKTTMGRSPFHGLKMTICFLHVPQISQALPPKCNTFKWLRRKFFYICQGFFTKKEQGIYFYIPCSARGCRLNILTK